MGYRHSYTIFDRVFLFLEARIYHIQTYCILFVHRFHKQRILFQISKYLIGIGRCGMSANETTLHRNNNL